ncbi:MAG: NAD(P)/FAD-dependent oxidoreductase, partial [Rhodospirillales bacterium]|nr:NAD(P)/FAD-dependent oxidoreductase [Rhodospirillales bacterium]
AATMSHYLIERIDASDAITLHPFSEVSALGGDRSLEWVEWRERGRDRPVRQPAQSLFVMIGAEPNSGWLDGCAELDSKGFVVTGSDGSSPFLASRPGLFAVGDVRAQSVKRVASGVGEGSVVIQFVHRWLEANGRAV